MSYEGLLLLFPKNGKLRNQPGATADLPTYYVIAGFNIVIDILLL